MQEETLRLKVDFSGINEGTYESYEQLRLKIAKAMVPTFEGSTEEEKWKTSMSIPILDCQRLRLYSRNRKRLVRVTFLYMKHKSCLLLRKCNLPSGYMKMRHILTSSNKKEPSPTNPQICTQN